MFTVFSGNESCTTGGWLAGFVERTVERNAESEGRRGNQMISTE